MSQDEVDKLVVVARAVKTRGLKGEIVADLLTDFPDRFADVSTLIALAPDGKRRMVELEDYWHHQSRVVFKFAGYDDIEAAGTLVGCEFAVPETDRVQLAEGHFYDWELNGFSVETLNGDLIGTVQEIMRIGGGVDMLVVRNDKQQEHLIPMVESIVLDIDSKRKLMRIDPPEGLLEL
ncbi:MAG TPA: ribosome maturation factor RimM [Pyrinomonadaceae bacterium]|nr:ribosome maturation factor RimM [Pyrinomonadaceae bacterium]